MTQLLTLAVLFASACVAVAQIPQSEWVNLTQNPDWDRRPAWSPDQSSIAFVRDNGDGMDLMVMATDGTDLRRLTDGSNYLFSPSWFPDSQTILYDVEHMGFFRIHTEGGSPEPLSQPAGRSYSHPALSPDGRRVAYHRHPSGGDDPRIFVADLDGSNDVKVTDGGRGDQFVTWSPDGSAVAFQRHQPDDGLGTGIYAVNIDGSGLHRVSPDTMHSLEPAWSPDGSRIAFVGKTGPSFELFVIDVEGTDLMQLTDSPVAPSLPAWSPDGRKLAFTTYGLGRIDIDVDIWVIDVARILGLDSEDGSSVSAVGWGQVKQRAKGRPR
jgi:Tol biopolymer transport system component